MNKLYAYYRNIIPDELFNLMLAAIFTCFAKKLKYDVQ